MSPISHHVRQARDIFIDDLEFRYPNLFLDLTTRTGTAQNHSSAASGASGQQTHHLGMFSHIQAQRGISPKIMDHIIDHAFLPNKLPQDGGVNEDKREIAMLEFFRDATKSFHASALARSIPLMSTVVELATKMVQLHTSGCLDHAVLTNTLTRMSEGDIIPLYIKAENAAVIIRHKGQEIFFETFEVSPGNESILKCQGRLLCSYPGPSVAVPATTFQEPRFLTELVSCLVAMNEELPTNRPVPRSNKAGISVAEIRDTVSPIYITEFLTGLLCGLGRGVNPPRLCKRVADEVLWNDAKIPWRRSPLWLVFRVALQTTLFQPARDPADQNTEYKILMLYLMTAALETAVLLEATATEKLAHMCKKLSRRAAKLDGRVPREILEIVDQAVRKGVDMLKVRFDGIIENSIPKLEWSPDRFDIESEVYLTMKNSRDYIRQVLQLYKHPHLSQTSNAMKIKHPFRIHHFGLSTLPKTSVLTEVGQERRIALHDMEVWVENSLAGFVSSNIHNENACQELFDFLDAYTTCAAIEYAGNPVDYSIMLLTAMEIWVALDRIATATCPLLAEHSCEVEEGMLSKLILPTEPLLRRLNDVESHIRSRKKNAVDKESVFEDCSRVSRRSFSVKYYNQSPAHSSLLHQITERAERQKQEKKAEFTRLKGQYDDLMRRSNSLSCECIHYGKKKKRKIFCQRCVLRRSAEGLTIQVYEWPLPVGEFERQALVVELQLPVAFRAWRDATYELLVNIFNPSLEKKCYQSKHDLNHYQALSGYFSGQVPRISWASEAKSFQERTHYQNPSIHSVRTEGDYLMPNGLVYQLSLGPVGQSIQVPQMMSLSRDETMNSLTRLCTFQLPNRYRSLQYALDSTDHTPNFSIANQSECPAEWSLHEYDAFTTLRSGFRIQWLNILREIRAGTVNLNRHETYLLFMQAAWQAGPKGDTGSNSVRESHLKIQEDEFARLVVDALKDTFNAIKENWVEQVSMQNIISLATRVLSAAPSMTFKSEIALFMRECRAVCMRWMRVIAIRTEEAETDDSLQKWQSLAVNMAAICRLTFNVDSHHIDLLFNSAVDVADFIECAACIHKNRPLKIDSPQLRMMVDRDGRMAHRLEPHLRTLSLRESRWLDDAIRRIWPKYNPEGRSNWTMLLGENDRWIQTQTKGTHSEKSMKVHYNLLEGALLVDGAPFGRLPEAFTNSPIYSRLLGNRIISVGKANIKGMEYQMVRPIFVDGTPKSEAYLYFAMRNGELIIQAKTEKEGVTERHELIPHEKLTGDFPATILNHFAHWIDLEKRTVEFRNLHDTESRWLPSETNYKITIISSSSSWRAEGVCKLPAGSVKMVDCHGSIFQAVGKIFGSIESPEYIEITVCDSLAPVSGNSPVNISLPRYKLDFEFSAKAPASSVTSRITSRNFPGMVIDTTSQDLRTLYGLKNYIVLREEADGSLTSTRNVIIPHGAVSVTYGNESQHPTVIIDRGTKLTIKYHLYTIDTMLGCLTTNGSLISTLFKIYLHAITASCLPDPLTGLTGTEQALDDLRSSRAWSFQKLDSDDTLGPSEIDLLTMIGKLTPKRKFYPPHLMSMQQIEWSNLPSYIQHEDFDSTVQSILKYAQAIFLFQPGSPEIQVRETSTNREHLYTRASLRAAPYLASDYGGSIISGARDHDVIYYAREKGGPELEARVYVVSTLVKNWTSRLQPVQGLAGILKGWKMISTSSGKFRGFEYRHRWHEENFGEDWYSLYNFFRKSNQSQDRFKILFILCSFSYQGEEAISLRLIKSLLAFATNEIFSTINPPDTPYGNTSYVYDLTKGAEPEAGIIRSILQKYTVDFDDSSQWGLSKNSWETDQQHWDRRHTEYEDSLQKEIEHAVTYYQNQWECSTVSGLPANSSPLLTSAALVPLNERFGNWYHNMHYMQHIAKVQRALDMIGSSTLDSIPPSPYIQVACYSPQPVVKCLYNMQDLLKANETPLEVSWNFRRQLSVCSTSTQKDHNTTHALEMIMERILSKDDKGFQERYIKDLGGSLQALKESHASTASDAQFHPPDIRETHRYILRCAVALELLEDRILGALGPAEGTTMYLLQSTGLGPRPTTRNLLRQLACSSVSDDAHLQKWQKFFINLAELISVYQQALRLHYHVCRNDAGAFMKEWANRERRGWNSSDHPEWLLFEIENNILIRQVQAEIASEMLMPSSGQNTVMQLNMGEGKSSVIIPIVAAALADKGKLVRVVVLKPLSSQMFHLLVQKLGGLLNRRIYYLPFFRQMELDSSKVELIQGLYAECMKNGGILLSQPEHILSFKLVGLENLCKSSSMVPALLESQRWLEQHCRDILDESDEVLHVRYQLIYTMGEQRAPDFSPDRWCIIQEIFTLIDSHLRELKKPYPDAVELIRQELHDEANLSGSSTNVPEEYPGSFPLIRLLEAQAGTELMQRLADDIIKGGLLGAVPTRWLTPRKSQLALKFITHREISADELKQLEQIPPQWLLLRGLIAHGILGFVLREKRWRVDYGLALSRSILAVPFRAKDSPAPRAEFAHPDVTIALTCLSYYYQGLEEKDLRLCFERLNKLDNPGQEYLMWVRDCRKLKQFPETLQQLNGINLEDEYQWNTKIYPLLKLNKRVIDFYLGSIIFPKACKEFPNKLTTSGWDLVEEKTLPTTGFSGTNDNRYLLPVSIKQLDLDKHKHTNAKVLSILLQPENNYYTCAKSAVGERLRVEELLDLLVESSEQIQVLLDVGAQVLEMSNQQVAKHWLGLTTGRNMPWTAAVYFDDGDELMVIGKDGSIQRYMISPYVKNMEKCLVYLDESHTRGTDIKLPQNSIAAVTLGPKVTKDRLVQACMRMRQLGHGQSVRFFAPPEVHNKLLAYSGKEGSGNVGTDNVIEWVIHETCTEIQKSIPLWANQGIGHQIRQNAWDQYFETKDRSALIHAWQEPESETLEGMYGISDKEKHSVVRVIEEKLACSSLSNRHEQLQIILQQCGQFGITSLQEVLVQEEQEREVANEVEREQQVERPTAATPANHILHPAVTTFIETGIATNRSVFLSIPDALRNTSFYNIVEHGPWSKNLLATVDFINTVKYHTTKLDGDNYLRPVSWIVSSCKVGTRPILCLLSPYEVNELIPKMKNSQKVNLHMYSPKVQRQIPTFEDLRYASIPPLPSHYTFTGKEQLMLQLNLFAGQLFFQNYESYRAACGFLGIYLRQANNEELPEGVEMDGFLPGWRREGHSFGNVGMGGAFQKSPIRFLQQLMAARRKGMKYESTHMGMLVHAKELGRHEFQ